MKKGKEFMIILYTIGALLLNLSGRILAEKLVLPVWLDSVGTFLLAYVAGPVCGAGVGFSNNIIYGIFVKQQSVYCIIGAFLGIIVGIFSRKRVFDTQFKTMTIGMGLAIFSTFAAVFINTVLYDGTSGNIWGDQVRELCIDSGFPKYVSYILGQFCIEFLDKLICVEFIYLLHKASKHIRKYGTRILKSMVIILAIVNLGGIVGAPCTVKAEVPANDYDSYVKIQYSSEEGLLPGEANAIAQTKEGRLWIGTYAGLFKYDGSKFSLIKAESVKNVNCLYVDEEGRLWVGTNDDGVTVFINEHVMNVIDESSGLPSNTVRSITCDASGIYYIGTTEGISQVSLSGGVKVTDSFTQIKNCIQMSADKNGNVMAVTERGGLCQIKNGEICDVVLQADNNLVFNAVQFAEDGRLFLGTLDNMVLIYDISQTVPQLLFQTDLEDEECINSFYSGNDGEMFICADTGVAVMQQDYTCTKIDTDNFTSSIDGMLIDYQGNLWFSSTRLGLLELCQSPFVNLFSEVDENGVANSVQKWKGLLFCGTDRGLVIIDEQKKTKIENELSRLLADIRIRCLKTDHNDTLWVATMGKGIYKISQKTQNNYEIKQFTGKDGLPGNRFSSILELEDGRIAVAGDYGVAVISGDAVADVFSERSLCLLEYKDAWYIGSDGAGITRIEQDQIAGTIRKEDGLSSDVIIRMIYDPSTDGVFIVTSNGLCYMSSTGEISRLSNFSYSNNYDMICNEDGKCWILSSAGIYLADTANLLEDKERSYSLINAKRGFHSSLTADSWQYRDSQELYLCTSTGVVKVNMDQCDTSVKSYRMIVDHVYVDGERYGINRVDLFKMTSEMDKIVFEPEVLNYSMNDPYVTVFLEGYDTEKSVYLLSELGELSYSNLKPGKYVFRIEILDKLDGKVVESGYYTIEKEIEMYQNWWFKVYVAVIAGLVLIWLTWFFTRTQAQKTLLKQKYELEYAKKQIKMGNETILSIARTVDAKDSNTSEHSYRVSEYAVEIARCLNYSEEKCENLRQMALLHDIGKIGIPDAILNKPSRLTDEEYAIMKSHVIKGGEILKDFTIIDNVVVGALYHHERYDGTGYCAGLKGKEIPLDARIIGIADAFDAMTANRVYRKQLDIETVIAELKRCSGTQFDPELVKIMLSLIESGKIDVDSLYKKSKEGR